MKKKLCEIVQQVSKWKIGSDTARIIEVLESKENVRDYAIILHDKDENVESHYHIAIRFKNMQEFKYVAKWFEITENFVGGVKGKWSDMLKYLTHKNALEKYQYTDEEVVSNFDWTVARDKQNGSKRMEEIINGIVDMNIREYNIGDMLSPVEEVKYSRQINEAYKIRDRKLLLKGDRKMECVFLTGKSGTGKTTYAKKIAKDKGYSYFISSSSNDALDGYLGQDVIILDDLRGSSFNFSDLLKMLDNNTVSSVKSRYRNKVLQCKMIIITSILEMEEFYKNVFDSDEEPIIQFKRRCKMNIKMETMKMYVKVFNPKLGDYNNAIVMPNPISDMYGIKEMDEVETLEYMSEMLTGMSEYINQNKEELIKELKDDNLQKVENDDLLNW